MTEIVGRYVLVDGEDFGNAQTPYLTDYEKDAIQEAIICAQVIYSNRKRKIAVGNLNIYIYHVMMY